MSQQQPGPSSSIASRPAASNGRFRADTTDPDLLPPRHRRQFTATPVYTGVILEEADRCRQPGEVGALLRREGLYSSHLTRWRVQLRVGQLEPRKRGRKANLLATVAARPEPRLLTWYTVGRTLRISRPARVADSQPSD